MGRWSCLVLAGKQDIGLKREEQDATRGNVATVTSFLVCQGTAVGHLKLHCESLVVNNMQPALMHPYFRAIAKTLELAKPASAMRIGCTPLHWSLTEALKHME